MNYRLNPWRIRGRFLAIKRDRGILMVEAEGEEGPELGRGGEGGYHGIGERDEL